MGSPAAALLCLTSALALASAVRAQTALSPGSPGLAELALGWAQGDYRSPLICEIDGAPHRALRRIRVAPIPERGHRPLDRLSFFDLDAPPGTRCHDELGAAQPNVLGSLGLTLEAHARPDIADRDFTETLRRNGGFAFLIAAGQLRIGDPGDPPERMRSVDFKGGTAALSLVSRGSDAFRRLADFGPRRKLRLVLTAPDETRLEFDLVQYGPP